MKEIKLDSNFEVVFDDQTKDVELVDGVGAFEQILAVSLTHYQFEGALGAQGAAAQEKIRRQVNRVARDLGFIDSISKVEVKRSQEDGSRWEVQVHYVSGEVSEALNA